MQEYIVQNEPTIYFYERIFENLNNKFCLFPQPEGITKKYILLLLSPSLFYQPHIHDTHQ